MMPTPQGPDCVRSDVKPVSFEGVVAMLLASDERRPYSLDCDDLLG